MTPEQSSTREILFNQEIRNWREEDLPVIYNELELKNWAPWLVDDEDTLRNRMHVFPEGQFVMYDPGSGEIMGMLSTNRVHWPDAPNPETLPDSWDHIAGLAEQSFEEVYDQEGNAIAILVININPKFKGQQLSRKFIDQARKLAKSQGSSYIIGPFRPSEYGEYKKDHSDNFTSYCSCIRRDGLPQDRWLRAVVRNGGIFIKEQPNAMYVTIPLQDFYILKDNHNPEQWFEVSPNRWECGETGYWEIDFINNVASYQESNLWGVISPETAPPQFPEFHELTIGDKPWYEKRIKELEYHHCDFQFFGMLIWDNKSPIVSEHNGNLIIARFDNETGKPYYSFIGQTDVVQTAHELITYLESQGLPPELTLVPEQVINAGGEELTAKFQITPQRDYFDYVYSVQETSELVGKKFHNRRKDVNKFIKENSKNASIKITDLSFDEKRDEIIEIYQNWLAGKTSNSPSEYQDEIHALNKYMQLYKICNSQNIGIYVNGQLIGFSFYGLDKGEWAYGYFLKTLHSINSSSAFLRQQTAEKLSSGKFVLMNDEYDMGIEGLRMAKELSRPTAMLHKYHIKPR